MHDALSPRDGDVLIVLTSHADLVYEIQTVPGHPQVRCSKKEDALRQARLFAKQAAVDAWYRDGDTMTLIGRYRLRV